LIISAIALFYIVLTLHDILLITFLALEERKALFGLDLATTPSDDTGVIPTRAALVMSQRFPEM
jgi:hypothetical protein